MRRARMTAALTTLAILAMPVGEALARSSWS